MNLSNCPQLVIYLILTSLSIISSYLVTNKYIEVSNIQTDTMMSNLFGHIIGMIVISSLLYWLCKNNHHTAAWIVLVFPLIFVLMILILLIIAVSSGADYHKSKRRHHPRQWPLEIS